jgi:hypothetical protein
LSRPAARALSCDSTLYQSIFVSYDFNPTSLSLLTALLHGEGFPITENTLSAILCLCVGVGNTKLTGQVLDFTNSPDQLSVANLGNASRVIRDREKSIFSPDVPAFGSSSTARIPAALPSTYDPAPTCMSAQQPPNSSPLLYQPRYSPRKQKQQK